MATGLRSELTAINISLSIALIIRIVMRKELIMAPKTSLSTAGNSTRTGLKKWPLFNRSHYYLNPFLPGRAGLDSRIEEMIYH